MNWLENFAESQKTNESGDDALQYLMESYYLIKSYQQKNGTEES